MTKRREIYKCEVCGNVVEVLHEGFGTLVCCGKPMILMKERNEDPSLGEKHVPVIVGNKVKVGSISHPMTEEHYIEWIEGEDELKEICKVFLKPGEKPETDFSFEPSKARAYCNLHGLWSSE